MHASQAVNTSSTEPAVRGRASSAKQQQQRRTSKRKPWRKFMLVCCAGAQTPQDVDDLYESQQDNALNGQQHHMQSSAAAQPVEATAAMAGPNTGLSTPMQNSLAEVQVAAPSAAAPTLPTSMPAKATATPQKAFPMAVGATRSLLDDDASEDTSSPVYQASLSSTPVANRLHALASPTAAAAELPDRSTAPSSIVNTNAATAPPAAAAAAAEGAAQPSTLIGLKPVRVAPPVPPAAATATRTTAAAAAAATPGGDVRGDTAAVRDANANAAALYVTAANMQQQGRSSTSSGNKSPSVPSSPRPASPFTNKQLQGLVAAELSQQRHMRQQEREDAATAGTAAAGAAENATAGPAAAAAVDALQLPALPAGLRIKTGRKNKAAASTAPAATAAAAAGDVTNGVHKPNEQQWQQQERHCSLQHWNSELEAAAAAAAAARATVPAAAASGGREDSGQVNIARNELAVTPEDSPEALPVSPRHLTYTTSRPPKSPLNSSSKVASSSTVVAGSSPASSSSSGGFVFTRSGAFNAQDSTSHNWVSPIHSSNSVGHSSYHTAPGFVQTKASVVHRGQGLDQGSPSEGFKGFDSAGFWAMPAGKQITKRSAASASAPTLAHEETDGSSPFVHQQFTDRQQQQLLDDWSSASQQQQQGERSSSSQQQQQQADDWSSHNQQQMSQSEEAEDWDVLPVLLSPLRIPSHREKAVEEVEDLTPLSPKMSVIGVSNSVINSMLSEEGFPLVPTGDDQGVSDLFAGTPRATSYSGMFSNSSSNGYANRHLTDAEVPDTPRRLRGVCSETGAVIGSRYSRHWQQQQQPRTRRYSGTFQRTGSRSGRGTMRRPASSEQLCQTLRYGQQLASSSEEDEGAGVTGDRHSSSMSMPPVRRSISTVRGRRLYGHMAADSSTTAAAPAATTAPVEGGNRGDCSIKKDLHVKGNVSAAVPWPEQEQQCNVSSGERPAATAVTVSSSLTSHEPSWPVITSNNGGSSSSSTTKHMQFRTAGAATAAPTSQPVLEAARTMQPGSAVALHPAVMLAGQPALAVQTEMNAVQAGPAATAEITSSSSNASGPAGISYSRLRYVSRSSEFARVRDFVSASADAGRSSASNSLVDIDPRAGSSGASLYTSGTNVGGSGALFSRTAWASLGRQPSSSRHVQTLVVANAPARAM